MPIAPTTTVNVRYMVDDVEVAVAWYTKHLGFTLLSNAAPAFADITLGSLRLLLSGPTSSAGRPMPDGERPRPGVGTEFISSSMTFRPRSRGYVPRACNSATIS
jgi:catechol 2,3-dioxygenase-like lactoylglutathione lyase family enzyme